MKLVYGDQVIENATVTVQPHNKPQRTKQLIELTVPADASNGGYAVRQLLGQDPDIGAKSVVTLEVSLTQQQIDRLKNITEEELRDIRNGVNPAMIYGVRVYDSEPMSVEEFITGKKWPRWFTPSQTLKDATGNEIICFRRDSEHSGETFCIGGRSYRWHDWKGDDLHVEEITEQEAHAIIAHSVKPTGEYLGCVQWFQHSEPTVIVRRDSHDRCTYFDQQLVTPNILWDYHMSQWVKSGQWTEITRDEAEQRIEQNRKLAALTARESQPGMCKREQFSGGGTPSPRDCDVCLEGPCPRVIPVQTEDTDSPAMQALRNLAQQRGIDPAGMEAKDIADRLIAANQRIAVLWPEPLSASLPDLAFVGVDYAQGPDISATVAVTTELEQQIVELTMHSVLTPGCWVIAFSHKEHFVVEISTEQKLNGPIPAAKLSGPIGVKFPLRHRLPVMPKDYGRQVVCRDMENFSIYDVKTGTLQGFDPVKKVFMVAEQNGNHMMYRRENEIWIIDEPTEGF